MPSTYRSRKFNCRVGSREYYRKQHVERLKFYGLREYKHLRKCRLCTRHATVMHVATGMTMACYLIARELGAACDGTPLPHLRLPQFIHQARRA